jgi:HAE1 family hydrophobic/amphiphilic exporter-1
MSVTRFSVDHPVAVIALTVVVIVIGAMGALNLGIVFMPDITAPTVTVSTTYRGASPAEMEQLIVKPIEDHITGVHNQDTLQSTIQEGQAQIKVRFLLGTDIDASLTDVQHRVDSARMYLPADMDPPAVTKDLIASGPVVTEAVSSTILSSGALSDVASTQVADALRAVPGVEGVTLQGALPPEFHVYPDPRRLAAVGAGLPDILTLLSNDNVTYPGGRVDAKTAETSVGVHGDVRDAADLAALPVQSTSAAVVRLGEMAITKNGHVEPRIITHVDAVPAVVLQVGRGQGADEVRTGALVRAAFADLAASHPDLRFREVSASDHLTAATVGGVLQSLLEGVVLTACVLMVALHAWRSALVVLVAIPTSLFATLAAMWALGFTLDLSSTMGLSLAIGILVDDSIVVLENIHRQFALGTDRRASAILGRAQIGTAAVTITLVDVVVFLPIGFASGVVGRVLREFGVVVGFATLVSLLVSFTLTPLLASRWSLRKGDDALERALRSFAGRFDFVSNWYERRALPWALAQPVAVIVTCCALLFAAFTLVVLGVVGGEVLPRSQTGSLTAAVSYPVGTPIGTTEAGVERLASAIHRAVPASAVVTTTGTKPDEPSSTEGGYVATLTVQLPPDRWADVDASVAAVRDLARVIPGAALLVSADQSGVSTGSAIAYAVTGTNDEAVALAADRIVGVLHAIPGVANVVSSAGLRVPQLVVRVDPITCAQLNVSPATAALTARIATGGLVATRVRTPSALVDVVLQSSPADRTSLAQVGRTPVRTNGGTFVHLADVAQLRMGSVQTKIDRLNRQRIASISASMEAGATVGSAISTLEARLARPGFLPGDTHVVTFGGSKLFQDTAKSFGIVLVFSLAGMYVLMVLLFGSFTTPCIVMCTLPVALVGALGSLALAHQSLNIFSVISIVMLFGLAAKNGILLVDFANRERLEGFSAREAIRRAAARRFKPIVMTTAAMILGSLPLALGFAEGGAFRQSMGTVLIGGLTSSLLLTLVLIPVIYALTFRESARRPTWIEAESGDELRASEPRGVEVGTALAAHTSVDVG